MVAEKVDAMSLFKQMTLTITVVRVRELEWRLRIFGWCVRQLTRLLLPGMKLCVRSKE